MIASKLATLWLPNILCVCCTIITRALFASLEHKPHVHCMTLPLCRADKTLSAHIIEVEFGTRIVEVSGQKIKF